MSGPNHVFEFANDAHRRLFDRDNVEGKTVRQAFPDLEGQGIYEQLDRVYSTGERYLAQGVNVRFRSGPSGPEVQLRLDFIYAPIFDESGAVTGIFCEGHDVTEPFAAQGALREREEQLRLATDAAEIGLWDVDPLGDVLFWPPRVKAMFGISPEVPVSMADFYAGLHPDDRAATGEAFIAACDPKKSRCTTSSTVPWVKKTGLFAGLPQKAAVFLMMKIAACASSAPPSTSVNAKRMKRPCSPARKAFG